MRNIVNTRINASDSFRGASAVSIVDIPMNRMPKPMKMLVIPLCFFFLTTSRANAPTITIAGAMVDGFRRSAKEAAPPSPARRSSCAVIVVPMLAPIITGIAWISFMIPALTKPTSMIVVAPELWITAVTTVPSAKAFSLLFVSLSSVCSSLPPAIC